MNSTKKRGRGLTTIREIEPNSEDPVETPVRRRSSRLQSRHSTEPNTPISGALNEKVVNSTNKRGLTTIREVEHNAEDPFETPASRHSASHQSRLSTKPNTPTLFRTQYRNTEIESNQVPNLSNPIVERPRMFSKYCKLALLLIILTVILLMVSSSLASSGNVTSQSELLVNSTSTIWNILVDLRSSIQRYLVWPKLSHDGENGPSRPPTTVVQFERKDLAEILGSVDNVTAIVELAVVKARKNLETSLKSFENQIKVLLEHRHKDPCICKDRPEENTSQRIKSSIDTYHADQTGQIDYALMHHGGEIISAHDTRPYLRSTRLFGFPWYSNANPPEMIITPGVMPGECWAFHGYQGSVDIALAIPIYVTSVTLEHAPKSIVLKNYIRSAPKQFSIWGKNPAPEPSLLDIFGDSYSTTDQKNQFLGRFVFAMNGNSLQNFPTKALNRTFRVIYFKIEKNHGNEEFTCVYRLRVHGRPAF